MNSTTLFLLVACGLAIFINVSESRQIILHQNQIRGSCKDKCSDSPTIYNRHNCKKISSCTLSSKGPIKGFHRCDLCRCECEVDEANRDVLVQKKRISIKEPALLGTCKSTCSRKGLVRVDQNDCHEIWNCSRARKGYLKGFVRCDHCTCTCVNRKYANAYRLENVRYDLSALDLNLLENGEAVFLSVTTHENAGNTTQHVTRTVSYRTSEAMTMQTAHTMENGLSVAVQAAYEITGAFKLSSTVTYNFKDGFTYTSGSTKLTEINDQIQIPITTPPHSSVRAWAIGTELDVDIPYTATLVTVYEDGSESSKSVSGVLNNVRTFDIRPRHEAARPLPDF